MRLLRPGWRATGATREWLAVPRIRDNPAGPLFPATRSARGMGRDGFAARAMTTRAIEKLTGRYVQALGLNPDVRCIRFASPP